MKVTSVRAFVELYMRLGDKLRGSGCSLGAQLEQLRDAKGHVFPGKRGDEDLYRATHRALDRIALYGVLVRIWSTLDYEEQMTLLLKAEPMQTWSPERGLHIETFEIEREMRFDDLFKGEGVHLASMIRDADGKLTDMVKVKETIPRSWRDEEIAERLHLTVRQVRSRMTSGGRKIRAHDLFAALSKDEDDAASLRVQGDR